MSVCLCIPRVSLTTTKGYIRRAFDQFSFGNISHICIIKNNSSYKVFIYYRSWRDPNILEILQKGEHINIVHSFPWFWKCSLNKNIFIP